MKHLFLSFFLSFLFFSSFSQRLSIPPSEQNSPIFVNPGGYIKSLSYTVTSLRATTETPKFVFVTTAGKQGVFYLDLADTSGIDDGTTIIVNANGKRYHKVSGGMSELSAGSVENSHLSNMAANRIKGTVASGVPQDLTPSQVQAIIDYVIKSDTTHRHTANHINSGVFAPGRYGTGTIPVLSLNATGSTADTAFLRRDGTWAVISQGTGGSSGLSDSGSNGMLSRISSGVTTARTLSVSGAGLSVTNGTGVSGNPTFSLANDVAAIEALNLQGFPFRVSDGVWTIGNVDFSSSYVQGTLQAAHVPAFSGAISNPAGSLVTSYAGVVPANKGGFGTINGIGKANGSGTVSAAVAGTDYVIPSGNITGNAGNVTGIVALGNGGTNASTAAGARTNLGATTLGANLFTAINPSAITFLRVNADNTASFLDAASFRTAIGAGSSSATVSSVGLSLPSIFSVSGSPVTSSGALTATLASQTANYIWAAPNGSAGAPVFRALVAADIPNGVFTTGSYSDPAWITGLSGAKISGTVANGNIATALTGKSYNGLSITSTTGAFTLTNAKTFAVSNTLTLAGTDGSTLNIGTGGTLGTGAFANITNYATLASPSFSGTPLAPTASPGTNTTQIATTAFVTAAVGVGGGKNYVTPEDYGAVGNGSTNDLTAFNNMLAANTTGRIVLKKGANYRINGTLVVAANGDGANNLIIEGYGAKITTTNASTTAVLRFYHTKRLKFQGVEVQGLIDFDGMWESSFEDCNMQDLRFGYLNTDTFDEHYWNVFKRCQMGQIIIYTGTSGDLTEFNSNSFHQCKIWSGAYAIKIYGTEIAQGIAFYDCDISYQTTSKLYVDVTIRDVQINLYTCYLDDDTGFPYNTKGVTVNTYGAGNTPNSSLTQAFTTDVASQVTSDVQSGVRNGSRLAVAPVNLIKNGDFKYGTSDISFNSWTATPTTGAGMFGKHLRLTATGAATSVDWDAVTAPYTGNYSLTITGRNVNNTVIVFALVINGTETLYNPVKIDDATNFVTSSCQFKLTQGQSFKFRMYSQASVSNTVDIAYVGLTYGRFGVLQAPAHPETEGVLTNTVDVTGSATDIFSITMPSYGYVTTECTCFGVDQTYPNGSTYSKHIILATRETGAITSSVTAIATQKLGLDITGAPTITTVDAGSGVLKIKATATDGLIKLRCKLEGKL